MDFYISYYSDEQLQDEVNECQQISAEEMTEAERQDMKAWMDFVNEEVERRKAQPLDELRVERDDIMLQQNMLKMSLRKECPHYHNQTANDDPRYKELSAQYDRIDRIIRIRERGVCPCGMDNPVLAFGMCEDCIWEKDRDRYSRRKGVLGKLSPSYPVQIV